MKAAILFLLLVFGLVVCPCKYQQSSNSNVASGNCHTCTSTLGSIDNDPVSCSTCKANYGLNSTPVSDCEACGPGKYSTEGGYNCLFCPPECSSCTGSSLGQCTSCNIGYFKSTEGSAEGSCQDKCDTGYPDSATRTCKPCTDPLCSSCSDASTCTKCKTKYFLEVGKCYPCIKDCDQCGDEYQCYNCATGLRYVQKTGAYQCTTTCPQGTFYDDSQKKCFSCVGNCETCTS